MLDVANLPDRIKAKTDLRPANIAKAVVMLHCEYLGRLVGYDKDQPPIALMQELAGEDIT